MRFPWGDGGPCHIDLDNPLIQITSYIENKYNVSLDGGKSFSYRNFGDTGQFINPADYDDATNVLYAGHRSGYYFRWNDPSTGGFSTDSIAIGGMGSVTAVSTSPLENDVIYLGDNLGNVFKVSNARLESAANLGTLLFQAIGVVSSIEIEADNPNHLLVTYGNYGVNSVWESMNGGATWVSVEGNLPDMPIRSILFNPQNNDQAFVATELGVWSTDNLNGTNTFWEPTNAGLANVRVDMLDARKSDGLIAAATHGRGLYTTIVNATPTNCAIPTNLTVTNIEEQCATLNWQIAPNATAYQIQYRVLGTDAWQLINSIIGSNYDLTNLTANTHYEWQVRTQCNNGSYSNWEWSSFNNKLLSAIEIDGADTVCLNTIQNFQIPAIPNAVSYNWTLPSGWTGNSTTNAIVVQVGTTAGTISVSAQLNCSLISYSKEIAIIDGCTNTVLDFDGKDDFLKIKSGLLDTISDFTLETWFYLDQAPDPIYAIMTLGNPGSRIFLGMNASLFRFQITQEGSPEDVFSRIDSDVFPSYKTWHHIAITYHSASKTATMYLDGTVTGINTDMLLEPKDLTATDSLFIGNSTTSGSTDRFLDGKIDEFRFWSYARSAKELDAYRHCSPVSPEEGLLVHYNFEEGTPNGDNSNRTKVANNMPADYPAVFINFSLAEGLSNYISTPSTFIENNCAISSVVLDFDGIDDHLKIQQPLLDGLTDFTIETWFYYDEPPTDHYSLFDLGRDWNARINMQLRPNSFNFRISNWDFDNSQVVSSTIRADSFPCMGKWHHAAISYESASRTANLYLNGIAVGVNDNILVEPRDLFNRDSLYIGRSLNFRNNTYFKGKMDDFRVWSDARSATEIQETKDSTLTGGESGLLTYYSFDQGIPSGDNTNLTQVTSPLEIEYNATLHGFDLSGESSNFIETKREATDISCYEPPTFSDNTVMNFNGADDFLMIEPGLTDTISDFTIETWFYMDQAPDLVYPFWALGNYGSRLFLGASSTLFRFQITQTEGAEETFSRIDADVLPSLQTWHYAAVTYQSATKTATLYLDGVVRGVNDTMLLEAKDLMPTDSLLIGWAYSPNNYDHLNGKMDEFRFWSTARSAEEINAYRNCTLSGMEEGLLVYYDFEEGVQNGDNTGRTTINNKTQWDYPATLKNFNLNSNQSNYTGASSTFITGACPMIDFNNCYLETLPVNSSSLPNGLYHGINEIHSTAVISADSTVVFKAGNSIQLNAGFHAMSGATLTIMIEQCPNNVIDSTINFAPNALIIEEKESIGELSMAIIPNPLRHQAVIEYELPSADNVQLIISDWQGRPINILQDDIYQEAGKHQVVFFAENFPAGLYLVSLQTKDRVETRKIILLE